MVSPRGGRSSASSCLLGGLEPAEFLDRYWQKEPLLVRGAIPDLKPLISAEELAGLACEDGVESRLVIEQDCRPRWQLRHGPFDATVFARLPERRWTLLVQDVDKLLPASAEFLEPFRFVPDWRFDDLMISYAVRGGSVGPHVDDYDVFLVQVCGRRRWLIGGDAGPNDNQIAGADLRILERFQPERAWTLEAGDLLYLPPKIPHHGIAESDDCMTYSVGFRAPSWQDAMNLVFERLLDQVGPRERFADPNLSLQDHPGRLTRETVAGMQRHVESLMRFDGVKFTRWLGQWLTESKEQDTPPRRTPAVDATALASALRSGRVLSWHPSVRVLFYEEDMDLPILFAGGESFSVPPGSEALVRELVRKRRIGGGATGSFDEDKSKAEFLAQLVNRSYLVQEEDEE